MNVRTDHRHSIHSHRAHAGLAAAALTAAVLAGTAACTGSSTPSAASTGATGTTSSSPSSAGTVSLPASSATATSTAAATNAGGTTGGASSAAAAAGGTPACGNTDVTVSLGRGSAAMSHDGLVLKFTDVSGHACTLRGYPGAAVASGGTTLLNAARELNGYIGDQRQLTAAPLVTLQAGQSASAQLEWEANAGEPCYPNGSGTLVVTAPNTTKSTPLRAMTLGSSGTCAGFEIHPVVAGVLS